MHLDFIETHGRARGSALAMVDMASARRWTWSQFDDAVNRVAHLLIEQLGACSGARVATVARNSADLLLLQFGCVRAGAIFVPINWRLAPAEIEVIVKDADPAMIFVNYALAAADFDGPHYPLANLAAMIANQPATQPPIAARQDWDAPSTLLYTSGTSGQPKGVMISESMSYWGCTNFVLGYGVSSASVFLCDLPLFHTAGLFAATRSPLLAGGAVLISPGFEPANTLRAFADRELGITHYFSVPQMAQMLWNHPDFDAAAFAALQVYSTGGAPNPAAQIERFVQAGIPMSDGFGMTETGSNFGMPVSDRALLIRKAGSIGLPFMSVNARIVDAGGDVADGAIGELWLKGPSITRGYWNQPERTAEVFVDGWFRTGDAARRDAEGFYFLVDRTKDMYISGGENVYPAEVEAAIAEIAVVAECAVIGMADQRWGEVGWAFVIAKQGQLIDPDDIISHCKDRLAAYKVPKNVIVGQPIPRTASGKVQKHLLKAMAETL